MSEKNQSEKKSYLVTGGASGIGQAVACQLLAQGHMLTVTDVNSELLNKLAADLNLPDRLQVLAGSVDRESDCKASVAAAIAKYGRLDGMSFNAGIQRYGTAEQTTPELWDEVMRINLKGAFLTSRAAIPELRKTRGAIVLMGSGQSLAAQQNAVAYVVAKHGLLGLSNAMAVDHAAEGIRVNLVAPGAIDTPMLRRTIAQDENPAELAQKLDAMHPLKRIGRAEEIANVVLFLLSEKASFITGEVIRADGGLLTLIGGSPDIED